MIRRKSLTSVLACTALISAGLSCISEQFVLAIGFKTSISLSRSELLPPWDAPATGSGFFDFDGTTNTFGGFRIDNLVFDNFGTYPFLPQVGNDHPIAYQENTRSPLLPYVFTPDQSLTSASASGISSVGVLDFQTIVGVPACQAGIGPFPPGTGGGPLCGAKLSDIALNIKFANPIFEPTTSRYVASAFDWEIRNLFDNPTVTYPNGSSLVFQGVAANSLFAGGVQTDLPPAAFNQFDPFAVVNRPIPANFAKPIPEPSNIVGVFVALGMGIFLHKKRAHSKE